MRFFAMTAPVFAAALSAFAMPALSDPLDVTALMVPQEQFRLDFEDDSKQFVLMVRRQGTAVGAGLLAGAKVTEFGMHPIRPGMGGHPRGYLEFVDGAGDKAYVEWDVRAVFVPGAEGQSVLLDNGTWEVVGGTGKFAGLKGAGSLNIRAANPTDRNFILKGELVAAK
ncbi:MAG: hypothetical protein U1D06_14035 [Paracoccaceae bacterium]|nr:hypothetical protein [Paracoccaceae bacterium]